MSDLLKHELIALQHLKESLEDIRRVLAYEKGEAQGLNYDWHDNAALDAVEHEQGMNEGRLNLVTHLIEEANIVDYPALNDQTIKLGSLVIATVNLEPVPFVMVGQLVAGANLYKEIWDKEKSRFSNTDNYEELAVLTTNSPLGSVAINASVGTTISYDVGKRSFKLGIEAIDQAWISENFDKY